MSAELWVVLICTALTLFFSVAHYTLRDPSRVRLEQAFARRRKLAALSHLDKHMDVLLLATGIVRTCSHLLLALAMLHLFGSPGQWGADLIALTVAVAVVLLFGVGIPHAWGKYAGEVTIAAAWPVLLGAQYALWPVAKALHLLDELVRRLSGHREEDNGQTTEVEQEILQLASEGQAEGAVDADEREMIESVIEFGDTRAGEIMTPRTDIVAIEASADWPQCQQTILDAGHSRIPVYEGTLDGVVGVLYAKDLLAINGQRTESFDLRKIMRKAFFVPETKILRDLLKEFKAQKVHMAIVLDEYGGTAGLVTIEDLLEQIVGDIADEYEPHEPDMLRRVDERTAEVDARMYIDDLNDELGTELPEDEDYDTIGGFVFSTLGYIPKSGEQFEQAGIRFTVLDAEQRKINRLRLVLPEQPVETEEM